MFGREPSREETREILLELFAEGNANSATVTCTLTYSVNRKGEIQISPRTRNRLLEELKQSFISTGLTIGKLTEESKYEAIRVLEAALGGEKLPAVKIPRGHKQKTKD